MQGSTWKESDAARGPDSSSFERRWERSIGNRVQPACVHRQYARTLNDAKALTLLQIGFRCLPPLSALPLLSHLGRLSTQRRLGLPFGLSLPAGLANISSFHIPAGGPPRGGPAPLQASFWLCAPRTGSSMKGPRRTSARRRAEADAEQAYRVAQSFQLGDGLRHLAAGTRGRPKRCVQAQYDKNVERAPSPLPSNVRRVSADCCGASRRSDAVVRCSMLGRSRCHG